MISLLSISYVFFKITFDEELFCLKNEDEDSFFDLLSRFQSERMDDQRCSLSISENKENHSTNSPSLNSINNGNCFCPVYSFF